MVKNQDKSAHCSLGFDDRPIEMVTKKSIPNSQSSKGLSSSERKRMDQHKNRLLQDRMSESQNNFKSSPTSATSKSVQSQISIVIPKGKINQNQNHAPTKKGKEMKSPKINRFNKLNKNQKAEKCRDVVTIQI